MGRGDVSPSTSCRRGRADLLGTVWPQMSVCARALERVQTDAPETSICHSQERMRGLLSERWICRLLKSSMTWDRRSERFVFWDCCNFRGGWSASASLSDSPAPLWSDASRPALNTTHLLTIAMVAVCFYSGGENRSTTALHGLHSWWTAWPEVVATTAATSAERTTILGAETPTACQVSSDLYEPSYAYPASVGFNPHPFNTATDIASCSLKTPHSQNTSAQRPFPPHSNTCHQHSPHQGSNPPAQGEPASQTRPPDLSRPARPDNFLPAFLGESDLAGLLRRRPRRSAIDLTGPHPSRPPPTQVPGEQLDRRKRRYACGELESSPD